MTIEVAKQLNAALRQNPEQVLRNIIDTALRQGNLDLKLQAQLMLVLARLQELREEDLNSQIDG